MKKLPAILVCFLVLGLLDSFLAFSAPISWTLQTFSLVPHFFYIGTMLYVYNKPAVTRILTGLLAGMAWDFLFAGTFPWGMLWFAFSAWICGLVPIWSNSQAGWTFFVLLAFCMDLLPYLVMKAVYPEYPDFFNWIWKMELFTLLLDGAAIFLLRYGADVMDRYFTIQNAKRHLKP